MKQSCCIVFLRSLWNQAPEVSWWPRVTKTQKNASKERNSTLLPGKPELPIPIQD